MIKTPVENDNKQDKIVKKLPTLTPEESLVFEALEPYPVHIDNIAREISMEPGKLSSILLQLELKGIVQQSPGKLFSIIENICQDNRINMI